MAVIGVSEAEICGVRDHATLLAEGLLAEGVECSMHWLYRRETSGRATRAEFASWTRALRAAFDDGRPDALLFHYSVFAYSSRGVPALIAPVLLALRHARAPVLSVFHEVAYPFRRGGWRGNVWAVTQRAALVAVMRACDGVLVTADFRAEWLASRPWLPERPLAVAPVFSNLPAPEQLPYKAASSPTIGLFGYSYQGAAVELVLEALRVVLQHSPEARLVLLGAPGPASAAAGSWLSAARSLDIAQAVSFSGTLGAQELSNALAACDVLLFADAAGPSSRKGSLAGSLASGRPVVAIDGRRTWAELVRADVIRVSAPTADALAHELVALLTDAEMREALGGRGQAFAQSRMGVPVSARAVKDLYDRLLTAQPRRARKRARAER
jgi:glycosyltransferase involved in cell wall biosynthesis